MKVIPSTFTFITDNITGDMRLLYKVSQKITHWLAAVLQEKRYIFGTLSTTVCQQREKFRIPG